MSVFLNESDQRIPSLIMDYLDEEPARYNQIREKICLQFEIPTNIQFRYKDSITLNYHLIYKSPIVERISQATIFLIAEFHDDEAIKLSNSCLMNGLVCEDSVVFAESVFCPKDDSEPIVGRAREIVLEKHHLSKFQDKLTVYGWDSIDLVQPILDLEKCRQRKVASAQSEVATSLKPRGPSLDDLDEEWEMENAMASNLELLEQPASIYSMFPERTSAMVESLKQLEQRRAKGILKGKAFYIAGLSHLYCMELFQDSNLSLKRLYQALRTLPAIVICPTRCWERFQEEEQSSISIYQKCLYPT